MEKIECKKCERTFNSKESLNQHFNAKHIEKKEVIQPKKKTYKKYIIWSVVGIILILIIWWFVASLSPSSSTSNAQYSILLPEQDHVKGDEDAEKTIIEFSDFECPFCGRFYRDTLPQIQSEFIDTGKVKFIYKHFPIPQIHQFALKAAEASECAADQGKFWEYHDTLFENQPRLSNRNLKSYAAEIGLNTTLFDACLDSGAMAQRVRADLEESRRRGVSSTPTFFIGEQKIEGSQPFSAFELILKT